MKIKCIALIGLLAVVGTLHARQVEYDLYSTFVGKLSLESGKVYVDCPGLKVYSASWVKPVKHTLAVDISDINYEKLKAEAAQGKTVQISARFDIGDDGKLVLIIANSKGKR